jgi:uncharacterized repeat protein (TIGR02543 family)
MPDDAGIDYGGNPATYTVEREVTLQDPPARDGYRFGGWYSDNRFQSPIETPAIPAGSTEDKTFYARWTLVEYDIIYMPKDEEIDYGDNPPKYTVESGDITLM